MNPLEETCDQCNNAFVLTDDRLSCLPQISNCQTYRVSNNTTANLTCLKCQVGYYLKASDNFCNKGDIQYCLIYEIDQNVCLTCQNRYYLKDGFCEPHDVIPNC